MSLRNSFLLAMALVAAVAASSCSSSNGEAVIDASSQRLVAAVNAKDINGIMAYYTPDETLLVFDAVTPRQYLGARAYRKDWEDFLSFYPSAVHADLTDWKAETDGNLAYGHGIFHTIGPDKDGKTLDMTLRVTDVFKKIDGKWLVVHEHVSWPVDFTTGKPDMTSKP